MKRGRKAYPDPPVEWRVNVPRSVADAIDARLQDPVTGRLAFGGRARLITRLLRQHLILNPARPQPFRSPVPVPVTTQEPSQ